MITDMDVNRDMGQSLRDLVADQLRDEIAAGFAPGDPLPSERQLAKRIGVGRDVIRDALGELRNEGLVVTTPGMTHRVKPTCLPIDVVLLPGDTAIARMPSGPERRKLRIERGTPVIEIRRGDMPLQVYPADGVSLQVGPEEAEEAEGEPGDEL
jgi:DNA-binding transcriptional MocR family regulator